MDLFLAVMCGGDEGLGISGFVKLRVAWEDAELLISCLLSYSRSFRLTDFEILDNTDNCDEDDKCLMLITLQGHPACLRGLT